MCILTNLRESTVYSIRVFPVDRQIVASIETPNRNYRLDPSRYNERGECMIRHLKQLGFALPRLCEIPGFKEVFLPKRFSRIYLDDFDVGLPMLGTSSMFMTRLPIDSRIKIEGDIKTSSLLIQAGDILVSRSGTIGTAVLCGKSYTNHVASEHCFRVRISESMRGFITAYICSPFGKTLLTRDGHGKVIRELKDRDIYNIRIPLIDTLNLQRVNNLMIESMNLIDKARESLAKAESKLSDIIGTQGKIPKPKLWLNWHNKTYLKDSGSLLRDRLDPHFYDPDISHLRNKLTNLPHKILGKIAHVWGVARFKRLRADKGYGTPLFSSADIMRARLKPSGHLSTIRNARNIKQCLIEKGTILIPCSGTFGGIMGRSVRAGNRLHGHAITQHVIRIKVTDADFVPDYVAALLGSTNYGYPTITAYRHGKDVPEIDPDELKSIPIPKLPPEEQEKVAGHISLAYANLDRANELEDEAQRELLSALQWTEEKNTTDFGGEMLIGSEETL